MLVIYTHLEASKRSHGFDNVSKDPHNFEKQLKGEGKSKNTTILKKKEEENKPTCSQCKKKGHNKGHYWKLHL